MPRRRPSDVEIIDQGSIVLFTPVSKRAKAWWQESVEDEQDWQRLGDAIAVDRRMAHAIYIGLIEAQFTIN